MGYRIIEDARPDRGPYRVTTLNYRYLVARRGRDIVRLHWHPTGRSRVRYPHLHAELTIEGVANSVLREHFPTGRVTYEGAIRWLALCGAPMARDDYEEILRIRRGDASPVSLVVAPPG